MGTTSAVNGAGTSGHQAQEVGGATAEQIKTETAAAQQVSQANHEANLAAMQMNANKAMGELMKGAI